MTIWVYRFASAWVESAGQDPIAALDDQTSGHCPAILGSRSPFANCARITVAVGALVTIRVYRFASAVLCCVSVWTTKLPTIAPTRFVQRILSQYCCRWSISDRLGVCFRFGDAVGGASDAQSMRSICNQCQVCDRIGSSINGKTCRRTSRWNHDMHGRTACGVCSNGSSTLRPT